MGKSIRSKIKRKHRSEFRRTIGTEAYDANMAKTQAKMKEYLEQQTMNSFERLSNVLDTSMESTTPADAIATMEVEGTTSPTTETTESNGSVKPEFRGENKAIPNPPCRRNRHYGGRGNNIHHNISYHRNYGKQWFRETGIPWGEQGHTESQNEPKNEAHVFGKTKNWTTQGQEGTSQASILL
eukprot:CAMPEP_0172471038 /NCGR_PEP_ID=MMETSP1065-20121228/67611_1 /TAXON_ID=265537 /ORGANISM="Amphiprora paludosa, Strain CCMP125" /LENGTH=182 /DNA_ID=CAMNT_0013229121 /DNA_START=76 /DNA_END=624 /DNA_ORIENTATION=+